jgi:hypothetical protein
MHVNEPVLKLWNESGTNRARIADSASVRIRSRLDVDATPLLAASCGSNYLKSAVQGQQIVNFWDLDYWVLDYLDYWVLADALPGCAAEMNCEASSTPVPTGVGIDMR